MISTHISGRIRLACNVVLVGGSLDESLRGARLESEEVAIWEEEDYCRPPLDQERRAVLDDYFDNITVEKVERGEGWERIEDLPAMWDRAVGDSPMRDRVL